MSRDPQYNYKFALLCAANFLQAGRVVTDNKSLPTLHAPSNGQKQIQQKREKKETVVEQYFPKAN